MNNFKTTFNGGMPLYNDDFRFIDSAVREAIKGLLGINQSSFTNPNGFVLWGCTISLDGDNIVVSEGAIALAGEVLYCPAQSFANPYVANPSDDFAFWFTLAVSYDPAGNKEYFDASVHDTYEVRRALLTFQEYVNPAQLEDIQDTTFFVGTDPNAFTDLNPILSSPDVFGQPRGIHSVIHGQRYTLKSTNMLPPWHHCNGKIEYWKNSEGYVTVNVGITSVGSPNPGMGSAMINLPVGFRPAIGEEARSYYATDWTNSKGMYVKVEEGGDVVLVTHDASSVNALAGGATIVFRAAVGG